MERAGQLDVKNVTRNALKKNNSALVEGVLPFDMEKLQPFDMGYLSGFQAEKRDMEKESLTPEVESEVKQYTVEQLKADVMGQYSAVRVDQSDTNIRDARWHYALLPVWILTYRVRREKDELYYFAMNGQTGKICGKLPVAKGKLVKLFLEIFVPVAAILMIGGGSCNENKADKWKNSREQPGERKKVKCGGKRFSCCKDSGENCLCSRVLLECFWQEPPLRQLEKMPIRWQRERRAMRMSTTWRICLPMRKKNSFLSRHRSFQIL